MQEIGSCHITSHTTERKGCHSRLQSILPNKYGFPVVAQGIWINHNVTDLIALFIATHPLSSTVRQDASYLTAQKQAGWLLLAEIRLVFIDC
jgi:hypothetical protein